VEKNSLLLLLENKKDKMTNLIGEFECKIDIKGRFMLPVGLKKQLPPEVNDRFVINRGFEKCLTLYPQNVWKKISDEVNQLNLYNKKNRDFVRYFYRGASEMLMDSASRMLLPKQLMEYADIKKDLVLFAYSDRIEIWAKESYSSLITDEPENFSALAEEVMGRKDNTENTD